MTSLASATAFVAATLLSCSAVFVPAADGSITYAGRTQINGDGSRSFDWEGTSFFITVTDATFVAIHVNVTGGARTRLVCNASAASAQLWVDAATNGKPLMIASGLSAGTVAVSAFNSVEPMYSGASATSHFTFMGFSTDGTPSTTPARAHNIQFVGDSITAGFGSLGSASTPGCAVSSATSSSYNSWGNYVCEAFAANCTTVAVSGKGVFANCCDNGELMPGYFQQTLGGESNTHDWDFSRWTPDVLIINLGTNDFGKDGGPTWEAEFRNAFVNFVTNVTRTYGKPTMPVFLAQGPMNNGVHSAADGSVTAIDGPSLGGLNSNVLAVIATLNAAGGNAHFLDVRGGPCDGCQGHPGVLGHRAMATKAIPQVAAVTGWTPDIA